VLNIAMLREINHYLESLVEAEGVCALVINGEGKTFSAGVDVPEHTSAHADEMITTFHTLFRIMHRLPMPTVCAIHGGVYGGAMELAIFCDIILAADNLKIGVPEITLGVFPPLAIAHLSKLIGVHKAAELIFLGAVVKSDEALRMGLVNHCYPADQFQASTEAFVSRFENLSAFSLRFAKRAFRRAVFGDFDPTLAVAETIYLRDLMVGHDPMEGLTAFMEKRKPVWTDR
jgi:cyclohexa-1,5-dienecarbonyl-CoA hydratase